MQVLRKRASIPYFLVGFGVCLSLFGPSIKSKVAPKQFNPTVKSAVSKLEITHTEMLGPNALQVIMKNGYAKGITAVVAAIGDYKVTRTDYIFAELESRQKLAPGDSDEFLYSIDSSEEENIVIKAVLFSDMTREGDMREIRKVLDKRLGIKTQLARFISHLEELNKVEYQRLQPELQSARRVAETLPLQTDDNSPMSEALEFGLKHGRAFILKYLSELNNLLEGGGNIDVLNNNPSVEDRYKRFRNHLLKIKTDFKSVVSRL